MPAGLSALEGELVGELLTPKIKTLLVESGQCHLIAGVLDAKDYGKGLLLDHFNGSTLFLS